MIGRFTENTTTKLFLSSACEFLWSHGASGLKINIEVGILHKNKHTKNKIQYMQVVWQCERNKVLKKHWFYYTTNHRGFSELWYQIIGMFGSLTLLGQKHNLWCVPVHPWMYMYLLISKSGLASHAQWQPKQWGRRRLIGAGSGSSSACIFCEEEPTLSYYTPRGAQEGRRMS